MPGGGPPPLPMPGGGPPPLPAPPPPPLPPPPPFWASAKSLVVHRTNKLKNAAKREVRFHMVITPPGAGVKEGCCLFILTCSRANATNAWRAASSSNPPITNDRRIQKTRRQDPRESWRPFSRRVL